MMGKPTAHSMQYVYFCNITLQFAGTISGVIGDTSFPAKTSEAVE